MLLRLLEGGIYVKRGIIIMLLHFLYDVDYHTSLIRCIRVHMMSA